MTNKATILVVLDTQHIYDRGVFEGIEQALRSGKLNWSIDLLSTDECLSLLPNKVRWDAVIANADHASTQQLLAALNRPTVALCGQPLTLKTLDKVCYVTPDHDAICQAAIDHFALAETTAVAAFSGFNASKQPWQDFRHNAFVRLARQQGLTVSSIINHDQLLQSKRMPLSVFCVSDRFAKELFIVSENLGLLVPAEVAIIGVDHDRMDKNLSRQRLSTIPFLPSKIGHQAVAALNTLFQGGSAAREKKTCLVPPEPIEIGTTTRESSNDEMVNRALAFIRANFHKGIKAEQVALALGVSRSHLNTRFKRQLGSSVHDNLLQTRLSFAAQQLVDTEQPIADIASQVGFASKNYLFQCFKQHFQMSPQDYRDRHRANIR